MSEALDQLVRRAQRGDRAAVERLLAAVRGPLERQARRLGVAAADVDDVVQDALLDVHRGLRGYRGSSAGATRSRHGGRCAARRRARPPI